MSKTLNKKIIRPLMLSAAVLAAAAMLGFWLAGEIAKPVIRTDAASGTQDAESADAEDVVYLDGKAYQRRYDLTTVLFLGIDQSETVEAANTQGRMGRSDTIILAVLDDAQKTMQLLEISRDTMVDVDIYDNNEELTLSAPLQITLQYSFGDNAKRSCRLTRDKVSELLYGMPIENTVSFVMDGIAPAVDAVGGMQMTFAEGDTEIDPAYTAGTSATLDGAAAERFIRYRDITVTDSNSTRMSRQVRVLRAVYRQLQQGNVSDNIGRLQNAAEPYLTSDLDGDTIGKLAHYTLQKNVLNLPGETKEGEFHDEYYVDEDALRRLLIQLFYEPAA